MTVLMALLIKSATIAVIITETISAVQYKARHKQIRNSFAGGRRWLLKRKGRLAAALALRVLLLSLHKVDHSKSAFRVIRTGSKVQRTRGAVVGRPSAKLQPPHSIDYDRFLG